MSKPLLSAVEFKLAQSSPAPSHKRDFLWVSCIKLCCSTNEASWALFDSYKTKLWSIKCKWIGTSICVWKQSSYTELSRVINASAASPQRSWRLDASVCLASRWSIRSNKDQVETQKSWLGLMTAATRGPSAVRRRPAAACLLSSGLGLRVTGCNSWQFLYSYYPNERKKCLSVSCAGLWSLAEAQSEPWGGSVLLWSGRKLLPVTGCCLMTTKLESFASFLCKRQAEVWSCSPWWWMPQSIFSAPCSGAIPTCWCWRKAAPGRASLQCLGVQCDAWTKLMEGQRVKDNFRAFKQQIHLYLAKINPKSVTAFYPNGRSKTSGSLLNWGKEPGLIAPVQTGMDCVWVRSCLWCCLRYPSLLLFWDCAG